MLKHQQLTVIEVSELGGVSEGVLRQLLEQGLLRELDTNAWHAQACFDATQLARVQSAARLRNDLGVNVPGVVLALELLDEINQLNQALEILKRHVDSRTTI